MVEIEGQGQQNQYLLTGNDFFPGLLVMKHDYKSRKDEFKPQLEQKGKKISSLSSSNRVCNFSGEFKYSQQRRKRTDQKAHSQHRKEDNSRLSGRKRVQEIGEEGTRATLVTVIFITHWLKKIINQLQKKGLVPKIDLVSTQKLTYNIHKFDQMYLKINTLMFSYEPTHGYMWLYDITINCQLTIIISTIIVNLFLFIVVNQGHYGPTKVPTHKGMIIDYLVLL